MAWLKTKPKSLPARTPTFTAATSPTPSTPALPRVGARPAGDGGVHFARYGFDILDSTKLVPDGLVPVRPVDKLTLNRNPDHYFAETEQVPFHGANIFPGIDFSDDPLLHGRLHSYLDTQLTRLGGPYFREIPINRAVCPVHNMNRDGFHRQTISRGRINHEPSSIDGPPIREVRPERGGFATYPQPLIGAKLRGRSEFFADRYSQATLFWQSQRPPEQKHIVEALPFELSRVAVQAVRMRMLFNLANVDRDLTARVAAVLGLAVLAPKCGCCRRGWENCTVPAAVRSLSMTCWSRRRRSRSTQCLYCAEPTASQRCGLRATRRTSGARRSGTPSRFRRLAKVWICWSRRRCCRQLPRFPLA